MKSKMVFGIGLVLSCAAFGAENMRTFNANPAELNYDEIGKDDVITVAEGVTLHLYLMDGKATCKGFRGTGKVCKWGGHTLTITAPENGCSFQDGVGFEIGGGKVTLWGATLGDCAIKIDADGLLAWNDTSRVCGNARIEAEESLSEGCGMTAADVDNGGYGSIEIDSGAVLELGCAFIKHPQKMSGGGHYKRKGSNELFPAEYGELVNYLKFDGDETVDCGLAPLSKSEESPSSADPFRYEATDRGKAVILDGVTAMYGENAGLGGGDFSVVVRAKTQAQANTALLSFGYKAYTPFALCTDADGQVRFVNWSEGSVVLQSESARVADPTSRYHVYVLTYDRTAKRMSFYADGTLVEALDSYREGEGNTYAYRLGAMPIGGGSLQDVVMSSACRMDELRIYRGTALTASQVAALQAELPVWPSPVYTATVSDDTAWGDIVWNEGQYTPTEDAVVSVTLANGAVLTVPGTTGTIPHFTVDGSGIIRMAAGHEGELTVSGSDATLDLVARAALIASGYTASGVTRAADAQVVFTDANGNPLPSEDLTLAASGNVWINAGNDDLWTNNGNWSSGGQPADGDHVIIEIAKDTTLAVPANLALGSLTVRGTGVLSLDGAALTFPELRLENDVALNYNVPQALATTASGTGRLVKTGERLTLVNGADGLAAAGGLRVDIAGGGVRLGDGVAETGLGDVAFVLGEAGALDCNGDLAFHGALAVSNATAKTAFASARATAVVIRGAGGSFTKGDAGLLTVPAKFSVGATPIDIQDGTLELVVAAGDDYTHAGAVSGSGHFVKSGDGTLTHTAAGNYFGGIEVVAGEMALIGSDDVTIAGVTGAGTLVSAVPNLYIVCNKPIENVAENGLVNEYSVADGTVKVAAGVVTLGKRNLNDGARIQNGTFILEGGTVNAYGWTRVNGTLTFDVRKDTVVFETERPNYTVTRYGIGSCTLVKKGPASLTVDAELGEVGFEEQMSVEIQEGFLKVKNHNSYKHSLRCRAIGGDGALYLSNLVTNTYEGLTVGNLTMAQGGNLADRAFTLTGTLTALDQMPDLGQTFVFANGAAVDLSALSGPFGGNGVFFAGVPGTAVRVTVKIGARTDCLPIGSYLCRLGAKPDIKFLYENAVGQVPSRMLRGVADGVVAFGSGLAVIVR